jgi:hypothetical protein
MQVRQGIVMMRMLMRLVAVPRETVVVLVMRVVNMRMVMVLRFMPVLVLMTFRHVEPHTKSHQQGGNGKLQGDRFMLNQDGKSGSEEGRNREVGAGSRRSQVTERNDEQNQAYTVSDEAYQHRG